MVIIAEFKKVTVADSPDGRREDKYRLVYAPEGLAGSHPGLRKWEFRIESKLQGQTRFLHDEKDIFDDYLKAKDRFAYLFIVESGFSMGVCGE